MRLSVSMIIEICREFFFSDYFARRRTDRNKCIIIIRKKNQQQMPVYITYTAEANSIINGRRVWSHVTVSNAAVASSNKNLLQSANSTSRRISISHHRPRQRMPRWVICTDVFRPAAALWRIPSVITLLHLAGLGLFDAYLRLSETCQLVSWSLWAKLLKMLSLVIVNMYKLNKCGGLQLTSSNYWRFCK